MPSEPVRFIRPDEGAIRLPKPNVVVRVRNGKAFYETKFFFGGKQVKRRLGPAWLDCNAAGDWIRRRGRTPDGFFDERTATIAAQRVVEQHVADWQERDRIAAEQAAKGMTFRELANGYLNWMETVRGARPSTLRAHRSLLAEPRPYARGVGKTSAYVMKALGDRAASEITTEEVEALLERKAATGVSGATVNRTRSVISAVFTYGIKHAKLETNPVGRADRRREPKPGVLVFYTLEEIEAVARAMEDGLHRDEQRRERTDDEILNDRQDAEAVRVAAYAGLRMGELAALRWKDVEWGGSALTIGRAMSAGIEGPTKSGHVRRVPMSDQAAAALERISHRPDFDGPEELVFCNAYGRHIDTSALRRRYKRARDRAGVRPLRWHDLRHTFGSTLAAGGIDLVTIKAAMGHADLKTTERYLHARSEAETAARFTNVFSPQPTEPATGPRPPVPVSRHR